MHSTDVSRYNLDHRASQRGGTRPRFRSPLRREIEISQITDYDLDVRRDGVEV